MNAPHGGSNQIPSAPTWRARRWHRLTFVTLLTMAVVAPPAVAAGAAALITVTPSSATPGTAVTVAGTGFPTFGGDQIRIVVGQTLVATVAYQPPGFSASFAAPNLPPGDYLVAACIATRGVCSSAPGTSAQARLRILAPPTRTPPRTTAPPPPPVGPTDLHISLDPVCCDPPGGEEPLDLIGSPEPTPGPGLQNPGPLPSFPDLYILGIEVTQNIQDLNSTMPLVAGRKTWVRVHPRANTGSWAPVDGAILVEHSGESQVLYPVNGPISTGLGVDRTDADSALNFPLDPQWYAEGPLTVTALVWAFSPQTLDGQEPNPENNLSTEVVSFHDGREPNVHVVPLDDGAGPGPSPSLLWTIVSALDVSDGIIRYHPIADTNLTLYPIPLGPDSGGGGGGVATLPAWDLTTSTGRTQPLQRLFWYHQELGLGSDERLFGMFDGSIPAGGYSGWAKSNLKSAWTKPTGTTPGHEAGHLTGLQHVDCVGTEENGGAIDPTHPNAAPHCSLAPVSASGYFGLTVFDTPFTIYSNDPDHPKAAFPLMSYASVKWNDAYHWCKMLTFYDVPCSPEGIGVPGVPIPHPTNIDVDCDESVTGPGGIELKVCLTDSGAPVYDDYPTLPAQALASVVPVRPTAWLLVSGSLDGDHGVIGKAALVDELAPSLRELAEEDEGVSARRGGGANEIVVRDSAGAVLARVKVGEVPGVTGGGELAAGAVARHGDGGAETGTGAFASVVPVAGEVATIELVAAGQTRATRRVSGRPPVIGDLTATPGPEGVRITWRVDDPDGDPVTSTLLWSADGTRWFPVAGDTTATSVLVGTGLQMPGGPGVRVKVIANDGVRSVESISAPFAVATRSPMVAVAGLPDGSRIPRWYLGELTAFAYDPEDGDLPGEAISWRSDMDGDLGGGGALSLRWLSAGDHTITATATDATGATGERTFTVTVVETGAPAPRVEGAEPEAERRLRAAGADSSSLPWAAAAVAGVLALCAAAAVWYTVRRRRARGGRAGVRAL